MEVKAFTLYPKFAISQEERESLSKWKLRCLQEEKIKMIREEIEAKKQVKTTIKYFISEKKHIQATQLVRLEYMHRNYTQLFPKR